MPVKIDPVLAWKSVEKLLLHGDNLDERDEPSDEEVERMMDKAGIRPTRIPSFEEIMAHAARRAKLRK